MPLPVSVVEGDIFGEHYCKGCEVNNTSRFNLSSAAIQG